MNASFTTDNLVYALKFPFMDPKWKGKMLIALAVSLGNMVVPIIPSLVLYGYIYQIMQGIIIDRQKPTLPEWADLGKMLTDGLKMLGAYIIFMLPTIIVYSVGMVVYFLAYVLIIAVDPNEASGVVFVFFMIAMATTLFSVFLGMGLSFATFMILPAAIGHMVAKGKFSAAFDFAGWWKVIRANPGGYILGILVFFGLGMVFMTVFYMVYAGMFICCPIIFLAVLPGIYMLIVSPALMGYMYMAGLDKLEVAA